jgi:hypothetical protein
MFIYWLLYLLPAILALFYERLGYKSASLVYFNTLWFFAFFFYTFTLGFRYKIGSDWEAYLHQFEAVASSTFSDVLVMGDQLYNLLNWLSGRIDGGIYLVNLICGAILITGVIRFCRSLPRSWLAFAVAVPFLIIVVGMGFTRQAAALGLILVGITDLERGKYIKFILYSIGACFFHKSAFVVFIFLLNKTRRKAGIVFRLVLSSTLALTAYLVLLADDIDYVLNTYIVNDYHSSGSLYKGLMNTIPAVVFLLYRNKLQTRPGSEYLWTQISILSIIFLIMTIVFPQHSAIIDRLGIYIMPIQLYVLSRIPDIFFSHGGRNLRLVLMVLLYQAFMFLVWVNFAFHANAWVPYRFYPLT